MATLSLSFWCVAMLGSGPASEAAGPQGERPQVAASAAAQVQALQAIKTEKTAAQAKLDSRLHLAALHQRRDSRLGALPDFRFVKAESDGRVPVEVVVARAGAVDLVAEKVKGLGGVVRARSAAYRVVSARIPLDGLEPLAAMPEVRRVRQAIPAMTHALNTSQGDLTHGAQEARDFFGVSGAGVKIGVLSDGIDSLAALQTSGDLPAVEVLTGQAGTGSEGTAMLEIVHDLAPGAALAFATAFNGQASFAQNILALAAAGCDVIVDDVIYLAESPFQDGPVAQAVNTVTAAGVLYFSSAGNEGNQNDLTSGTWEGDFTPSALLPPTPLVGAGPLHDFGDGGQSIHVEVGGGNPPLLIWAEHYDLATGTASTDYDLYVLDGALTTIFDASTDVQNGIGGDDFPIEFIGGGAFAGERLVVAKFADGTTTSAPMFNLIVFRGQLDDALATAGATRGHSSAQDAFSVAATPAAASFDGVTPDGPFPGLFTAANASESFTSDGPRRIILDPTGVELTLGNRTSTGGVVRLKPDITAADGVATATPGFNPFYGTSAAAPHAAAIAALLKEAVPGLTPAQARTALISSAIDIELPGVDRDTGAGILMAHAALVAAGATAVTKVTGTKTVSGTFLAGTTVVYTVGLTNSGGLAQADNPGDEFVDVLPAALTLVNANASLGTVVATPATNTVTWNGALGASGDSVAITIVATINAVGAGTTVSNQGTINYDADGNGTNETSTTTDDPGVSGVNDATSFVVVTGALVTGTKTVAGSFGAGGTVTYTVTLTNSGGSASADNAGDEFVDVLPPSLDLVGASAFQGTAVATLATNTVTWNGVLAAGSGVTVTITATIEAGTAGTFITNQGSIHYDADANGSNESNTTTDDPEVAGPNDPTTFLVKAGSFFTVAPCRVLDTRFGTPIASGGTLTVTLTGGPCGIPPSATAVAVNATVTQGQAGGFITLFPADQSVPNSSSLNFSAGQTRANNAVLALATDGSVKVLNGSGGTAHVVIDLNGYFE